MSNENLQILTIGITAISAIAAAISAFFSARSSRITLVLYKREKKEQLISELNHILEIGIEYPYLESKGFTSKWDNLNCLNDEKYLRYDMYCNLVFNYLHHVFIHFENDKKSIENFVDIKTWVRMHKLIWFNPADENENLDGYDEEFRTFINSYLK
jgi:hypothetical protein